MKICKKCGNEPALPDRRLCRKCWATYCRDRYREKILIRKALEEDYTLEPFVFKDGYELRVRRISKTAGAKLELVSGNESYAIILPPDETKKLIDYLAKIV